MKDVCIIVMKCGSVEVYDGRLEVIFVLLCVGSLLYVGSYENVDVED